MTVSLTVDYSNGAHKVFAALPWGPGMTLLDVLKSAQSVAPGLVVDYGSDRAGQAISMIIDGLAGTEHGTSRWMFWIDAVAGPDRLGTNMTFALNAGARADNEVPDGTHVLAKLVAPQED